MTTTMAPADISSSDAQHRWTMSRRVVFSAGVLLLLLGLLAGYAQVVVVSNSGFADHVAASLDYQNVRTALSEAIVTRLLQHAPPRAQAAEPVLQDAVGTVIGSTQFENIFRASLKRTHQVLLSQRNNEVALNLSRQAPLIVSVLQTRAPALASALQTPAARLKTFSQSNALIPAIQLLHRIRVVGLGAPILSVLCFSFYLVLAADRRRALRHVGLAVAIPAAVVWLLLALGEWLGPSLVSNPLSLALPGIWEALLSDLRRWCLILVIAGLALVAIADASSRTPDLQSISRRSRDWLSGTDAGGWRLPVLGVGVVVLGFLAVFDPLALFRLLLVAAGATAIYWGVSAALSLLAPATVHVSMASGRGATTAVGAGRWTAVAVVAVAICVLWVRSVWLA